MCNGGGGEALLRSKKLIKKYSDLITGCCAGNIKQALSFSKNLIKINRIYITECSFFFYIFLEPVFFLRVTSSNCFILFHYYIVQSDIVIHRYWKL